MSYGVYRHCKFAWDTAQIATLILIGANCLWSQRCIWLSAPLRMLEGVLQAEERWSMQLSLRMSVDADLNDEAILPQADPIFQAILLAA